MHRLCGKAASISPWNKDAGAHFSVLFPEGRLRQVKKWVCGHLREVLSAHRGLLCAGDSKSPWTHHSFPLGLKTSWLALLPP